MALNLEKTVQELVVEELEIFAKSLRDPQLQTRYRTLCQQVERGQVEESLLELLETALEISLQTGRVRRIHGPQAEQTLLRLFHQTPRGSILRKALQDVNRALEALQGHHLQQIVFTPRTPGVYRLVIDTDQCQLTLDIDREGVQIEQVAMGL